MSTNWRPDVLTPFTSVGAVDSRWRRRGSIMGTNSTAATFGTVMLMHYFWVWHPSAMDGGRRDQVTDKITTTNF